jgi:hypothetical protein
MAKYGVVHTTNLSGCDNYSFQSTINVENGALVSKGELISGEREIYSAGTDETKPAYLVAHPAWSYDDSYAKNQNEDQYINLAGKAFRVYELKPNKKFKITNYSITDTAGSLAVGSIVNVTGGKLTTATVATSVFVGKVIAIDTYGFSYAVGSTGSVDTTTKMVTIEVVKNA